MGRLMISKLYVTDQHI